MTTKEKANQAKVERIPRKAKEKENKSLRKAGKAGKETMEEDKGKSDQKGKGQSNNPHAGKQCKNCGKHGHLTENCWLKVSSVEAQSGTQNSQEPKPEVKGSTGGSGSVAAIHEGYDHDKVIFTVDDGEKIAAVSASDGCKLRLVDAGACENVAKSGDFRAPVDRSKAKPLFSV